MVEMCQFRGGFMSPRFWITWTALTAGGWAVGLAAGLLLGAPIEVLVGMMLVTPAITGLAGMILGTGQWLALRRWRGTAWWVPASAVGLSIGLTLGVTAVELLGRWITSGQVNVARLTALERAGSFAVIGIVTGLFLGAAQWLVLRRAVQRSADWTPTTTLAMTVALVSASLVADIAFGSVTLPLGLLTFVVLSGCTFGVITGLRLRAILQSAV
jgi:hypothetical protein